MSSQHKPQYQSSRRRFLPLCLRKSKDSIAWMEGYGSGQRAYGGDRRLGIVSARSFGPGNQIYGTRPRSPDPASAGPRVCRPSQSASKPWGGFSDPEMQGRMRVAKYRVYTVEGKVKASLRKGIQWIKNKCSQIIRGY